jgi:uncharacterized RDD family membrane protein YckC
MEPTEEQRGGLPPMPTGVWETTEPAEPEPRPDYASWGSRAVGWIIDNLLLAIPWAIGITLLVTAAIREDDGRDADSLWLLGGLVTAAAVIIPFVYFAILNGNERGQTLGKRVAGIRTRKLDGVSPLGTGRALGRYAVVALVATFLGPLILVDYLWPLWDDRNQALHDKVVDSVVVRA